MSYLILSTPSEDDAWAISHELWMLVMPRNISGNDTSQYYCGVYTHTDGTLAIGPLDGTHPIHVNADEELLPALIGAAVTDDEELLIEIMIGEAKGGSLDVLAMIQQIDSLSPNLRTRDQLVAAGWFPTDGV